MTSTTASDLLAFRIASFNFQAHWPWAIAGLSGAPGIVWGAPGSGKTAVTDSFCQHLNGATETVDGLANRWMSPEEAIKTPDDGRWHYHAFQLSAMQPDDWKGIPFVQKGADGISYTCWVTDAMLHLIDTRKYFVLLDEMGSTPPACQAACLGWACRPHGSSIIMAAGNPPETACAGVPLAAPMVSRFWMGEWDSQWTDLASASALLNGTYPEYRWPVLPANWKDLIPGIAEDFVGWRAENGWAMELVQAVPTDFEAQSKPHPTVRSWHMAIKALAAATSCGATRATINKLLEGFVGRPAARDFMSYIDRKALPDPSKWLRGPYGQNTAKEISALSANQLAKCLSGMVSHIGSSAYADNVQRGLEVLDTCWNLGYGDVAQLFFPMVHRMATWTFGEDKQVPEIQISGIENLEQMARNTVAMG